MGEALGMSSPADETDQPLGMRWSVGRVATIAVVVAMVIFWTWIFAGGPRRANPDRLDDRAFAARTEARCTKLRSDLKSLPNASLAKQAGERAAVLVQANQLVATMVDQIAADAPRTGEDSVRMKGWLSDWRTYLADRQDYASRLRTDPGARLLLHQNKGGDPVDSGIERFADLNDMADCATPGDVG